MIKTASVVFLRHHLNNMFGYKHVLNVILTFLLTQLSFCISGPDIVQQLRPG